MGALDGLLVLIKDIRAKVYSWPVIICGVDSNGNPVPFGASPASGGGGGGIPVTPQSVTPNFFAPASTTPVVIPVGAIGASVLILTGTGTLNGVDQPLGVPWTEPNKLAATVTLVLGSPGTARVYYGT